MGGSAVNIRRQTGAVKRLRKLICLFIGQSVFTPMATTNHDILLQRMDELFRKAEKTAEAVAEIQKGQTETSFEIRAMKDRLEQLSTSIEPLADLEDKLKRQSFILDGPNGNDGLLAQYSKDRDQWGGLVKTVDRWKGVILFLTFVGPMIWVFFVSWLKEQISK
jgi:hypothetical protein